MKQFANNLPREVVVGKAVPSEFFDKECQYYHHLITKIFASVHTAKAYEEVVNFVKRLRAKYDQARLNQCVLYHVLAGSTPEKQALRFFDFRGKDSVAEFIKRLEQRYLL